jgi:aryl-alcohol dehydrogenase
MPEITAAVCRQPHGALTLEALRLDDPRADEVLVRIVGSGICHTDLAVRDQQLPTPMPVVLGHEGAGIVEAVGADVTHVKPGDRVLMSFNSCGTCPCCHDHAPTYCYNFFPHNFAGARADGSYTLHAGEEPVHGNFFGQSSFATYALATARNVVRVPDSAADVPLQRLAPLGCGMMTGAGAILRSMKVQAGMPIAVFGAGAVGLAAVMAARLPGPIRSLPSICTKTVARWRWNRGRPMRWTGGTIPLARLPRSAPKGWPMLSTIPALPALLRERSTFSPHAACLESSGPVIRPRC